MSEDGIGCWQSLGSVGNRSRDIVVEVDLAPKGWVIDNARLIELLVIAQLPRLVGYDPCVVT